MLFRLPEMPETGSYDLIDAATVPADEAAPADVVIVVPGDAGSADGICAVAATTAKQTNAATIAKT
jgi:hypothetical protein